jgi:hypothetical protein
MAKVRTRQRRKEDTSLWQFIPECKANTSQLSGENYNAIEESGLPRVDPHCDIVKHAP